MACPRLRPIPIRTCIVAAILSGVGAAADAGDWSITTSLADQEQLTDNALYTSANTRSDLITTLSPGILINGNSVRLQGTLSYSPTIYAYAFTPSQDAIGQNLYANGTATVIPDTLFFDARAFASMLPTTPGLSTGAIGPTSVGPALSIASLGAGSPQGLPPSQLSQTLSFNASPYLVHRFDGFGTAVLRYTLSQTSIASPTTTPATPAGTAAVSTSDLTNEGTASFLTGEEFGPFVSRVTLDAAQSTGTGVYNGANQFLATDDMAYAINKRIAVLATIGHETINYGGLPPTHIDDLTWGGGIQLTPAPGSSVNLTYNHRAGVSAPYATVIYSLSAATTLSGTYSEGLSTTAQDIANNLAVSDVNDEGRLVDSRTLLPAAIANPALGLLSGVYRMRQLSATADTAIERNHFTATIAENESVLVAQSAPGVGASTNTTNATLSWGRQIGPRTTATLVAGYNLTSFPTLGRAVDEDLLTASLSISYMFSASLQGWAGYSRTDRFSPDPALRLSVDMISAGLSKNF